MDRGDTGQPRDPDVEVRLRQRRPMGDAVVPGKKGGVRPAQEGVPGTLASVIT